MSSDHESAPLVPSPPGFWRAADIADKTPQCIKQRDKYHVMHVGSRESKVPQCGWDKAPLLL